MTTGAGSDPEIAGVILAGGRATRMGGGDKPSRQLAGRPMLAHVIERLEPQVSAIVLNANGDPRLFRRLRAGAGRSKPRRRAASSSASPATRPSSRATWRRGSSRPPLRRGHRFVALSGAERIAFDADLDNVEEKSPRHQRKGARWPISRQSEARLWPICRIPF